MRAVSVLRHMQTRGADPGDLTLYEADALIAVDAGRRILCMNPQAEALTGYAEAEAVGRPCDEVLRASLCGDGCPFDRAFVKGEQVGSFDARIQNRLGEAIPVCMSVFLLKGSDGEKVALVESVRDVRPILKLTAGRESSTDTLSAAVITTERDLLVAALRAARTTKEAAKRLGISRATLWRKMKRCGITLNRDSQQFSHFASM